jgi:hypothetical protein
MHKGWSVANRREKLACCDSWGRLSSNVGISSVVSVRLGSCFLVGAEVAVAGAAVGAVAVAVALGRFSSLRRVRSAEDVVVAVLVVVVGGMAKGCWGGGGAGRCEADDGGETGRRDAVDLRCADNRTAAVSSESS